MVLEDGSDLDWKRLANAVRTGVRFLDNILTVNHYPIEECKLAGQNSRRIGLGIWGDCINEYQQAIAEFELRKLLK